MDLVRGTSQFRTSVEQGKKIVVSLRGHTSGMAIPYYAIDLLGGKGKVPIPTDTMKRDGQTLFLPNDLDEVVEYPDCGG